MFHRGILLLLPALLALAFAVPMGSPDGIHATAFKQFANSGADAIVSSPFRHDDRAASQSQSTSEDDDDDRVVQASGTTVVVPVTVYILPRRARDVLHRVYSTVAAFPRGPPFA